MKKFHIILIIALCAALSFVATRRTVFAKGGDETILIPADQVIDDNFINAGGIIDIKGKVIGDVIIAGGQINIEGIVEGDVIAAGGQVTVKGTIDGDVRVVGGSVIIDGSVKKNVNAFGGNVTIGKDANIGGSLLFGAGMISIDGKIEKDAWGGAGAISINGEIGRKATIYSEDSESAIQVGSSARIGSGISYLSDMEIVVNPNARIQGEIKKMLSKEPKKAETAPWISIIIALVVKLFSMWILGLVLISLFKHRFETWNTALKQNKWSSLGRGLCVLILGPIVFLLLLITVIGAPLALIILGLWLIALAISKILMGVLFGMMIFEKFQKNKSITDLRLPMLVGVGLVALITSIPIFGWIVKLLIVIFGMGIIWIHCSKNCCMGGKCCEPKKNKAA